MAVVLQVKIAAGDEFGAAQRERLARVAVAEQLRHLATTIEFGAGRLLQGDGTYAMGLAAEGAVHVHQDGTVASLPGQSPRGDINVDGVSIGSWFLTITPAEED